MGTRSRGGVRVLFREKRGLLVGEAREAHGVENRAETVHGDRVVPQAGRAKFVRVMRGNRNKTW